MLQISFHSAAQKRAFLRTSGIQACEIVRENLASLEVIKTDAIDWAKNVFVREVTEV